MLIYCFTTSLSSSESTIKLSLAIQEKIGRQKDKIFEKTQATFEITGKFFNCIYIYRCIDKALISLPFIYRNLSYVFRRAYVKGENYLNYSYLGLQPILISEIV